MVKYYNITHCKQHVNKVSMLVEHLLSSLAELFAFLHAEVFPHHFRVWAESFAIVGL